jgi:hypothetical protein
MMHLVNGRECLLMAVAVAALLTSEMPKNKWTDGIWRMPLPLRWMILLGLLFILILFGKYNESPAFIYFQF